MIKLNDDSILIAKKKFLEIIINFMLNNMNILTDFWIIYLLKEINI